MPKTTAMPTWPDEEKGGRGGSMETSKRAGWENEGLATVFRIMPQNDKPLMDKETEQQKSMRTFSVLT